MSWGFISSTGAEHFGEVLTAFHVDKPTAVKIAVLSGRRGNECQKSCADRGGQGDVPRNFHVTSSLLPCMPTVDRHFCGASSRIAKDHSRRATLG